MHPPPLSVWTPITFSPRASHCILPKGVGWEGRLIRLFSEVVPQPWFYFSPKCSHFLKRYAATRVWLGARALVPLLDPYCGGRYCVCVCVWAMGGKLGFFSCAIIPQVPRRPSDDTWGAICDKYRAYSRSSKSKYNVRRVRSVPAREEFGHVTK